MEDTTTAAPSVAGVCHAGAWALPSPAIVFDAQCITFANAAALRRLGFRDQNDLVGRPIESIVHSDALHPELARREVVAATKRPLLRVPTKLQPRDGKPIQQIADVFPIEVSGSQLTLITLDAEPAPGPSDEAGVAPVLDNVGADLGIAILEAMTQPIMIQNLEAVLFANASARAYLGASDRSEIEGVAILSIIHPDGLVSALERMGFVFTTHQRVRNVPIKLKALDGRVFHAQADAYPMQAEGSWTALVVGRFVRDA